MKKHVLHLLFFTLTFVSTAQGSAEYEKLKLKVNDTSFDYYVTDIKSKSVVLIFHDWFGISDLSFEMMTRLNKEGFDVQVLDLYKGKSGKNNQEARQLMNSVDMANAPQYIDAIIEKAEKSYENVFIWGFSLGTQFASLSAIRNNAVIDGLVLFYGNVPQGDEQLAKMTFPSLMVMGSKDNPAAAIRFFNSLNKDTTYASLFIYPNAGHAFAQKLFNGGRNYDEEAMESSFRVAYDFLLRNQ
ncbi:MAG: alpha/beta fold hydrolase [Bacteroidota bacterium]